MTRTLLIALALCIAAPPALGAYWVESFTEEDGLCSISRGAESLNLLPLMALTAGDIVDCTSTESRVFVVTDDDKMIEVASRNSPLIVPDTPEPPTLIENIRSAARGWFSEQLDASVLMVSLSVRGPGRDPVEIIGASESQNLVLRQAGMLRLWWTGGQTPFAVSVVDGAGVDVYRGEQTNSTGYRVPLPDLSIGRYRLSLIATGSRADIPIEVVGEGRRPDVIRSLETAAVPPTIRDRYVARVLASYPEWQLQGLSMMTANGKYAREQ
jgi:hypothetical protein